MGTTLLNYIFSKLSNMHQLIFYLDACLSSALFQAGGNFLVGINMENTTTLHQREHTRIYCICIFLFRHEKYGYSLDLIIPISQHTNEKNIRISL